MSTYSDRPTNKLLMDHLAGKKPGMQPEMSVKEFNTTSWVLTGDGEAAEGHPGGQEAG